MSKPIHIFPIVGVGASAGGIESFEKFLNAVPDNSGIAYVLVQHLHPSHESSLPAILSRTTSIPIYEIRDKQVLQPNHIYILPSNSNVEITDNTLKLSRRTHKWRNLPIDFFFTSLAKVHKTLASGVVLSGTAHDGTKGLMAIKEHGGITFVEDPRIAAWEGMPQSTVDAGVVDFILDPAEIPGKLQEVYAAYTNADFPEDGETLSEEEEDAFRQILSIIRLHSNVDFNYYKRPTLHRRIARRMAIKHAYSLTDYLHILRNNKPEQETLFKDMLIQVSSFFRDSEPFAELEENILPSILLSKSSNDPIRIWVAGCATGEEAYSLAICLHQATGGFAGGPGFKGRKIRIFASDLSGSAIEKARSGIYSEGEVQNLSVQQLKNYFTKVNGGYKVSKTIRDIIVFVTHNFLKDPPFAKMDLISCRNVFIYMDTFLQKKALTTFHYALGEQGFLLLGKTETTSAESELFMPVSKQEKIFMRKAVRRKYIPTILEKKEIMPHYATSLSTALPQPDFRKSAEEVLLSKHTPPSVIVDDLMEVVHINGIIAPFLQPPPGVPTFNLIKMANESLSFELRNSVYKARNTGAVVHKEDIPCHTNGERFLVTIEIIPLPKNPDPYYLILFWKKGLGLSPFEGLGKKLQNFSFNYGKNELENQNNALKTELAQAREDMRKISDDQEATNEELQRANEELLSSNEELHSLNEELETSEEQLQSTNEELVILNRELVEKQDELYYTLSYMEAILATIREPLLVLDRDLRIRTANSSFYKKFNVLLQEIVGKNIFAVQQGLWDNDDLRTMLNMVLPEHQSFQDFELELQLDTTEKRKLHLNAREIKDDKKEQKLILLAIEDVTEQQFAIKNYTESIEELKKTNEQLDQFVRVASHDLQEPLRKIMTFSHLLRERADAALSNKMKTFLDKIETSGERMAALIKDLLDYSRLANPDELYQRIDLNETIGAVLADFELLIEQKKASIKIRKLPEINAVPLQISQLFYNLIGNGLKFSKKDISPNLQISSGKWTLEKMKDHSSLDPDLDYIEIIVKDNGIGFDQKDEEKIFTIFHRLHSQDEFEGTGIGLGMVRKIAENHFGKVFAKSLPGQGAEFHVVLPVEQPPYTRLVRFSNEVL